MSNPQEVQGWGGDQTAEDFANLVKAGLGDQDSGMVVVPFENYALPDHIVFGGSTEVMGQSITYGQLFMGAVEHFHGLRISSMQAVPTGETPRPFSMGLQLFVQKPE
jgi:hypothetical protein